MQQAARIDAWWAKGTHLRHTRPRGEGRAPRRFGIFARTMGSGSWLTLLHGFPTSSWDYAPIAETLASRHRLLLFDFLGFGDSDKPQGYAYSLLEQADVTEAIWRQQGLAATGLVAHDYGLSVALELLQRQSEGRLAVHITRVLLLNGGMYVDRYRPILIQRLLQWPVIGMLLARGLTETTFARNLTKVFAPDRQPTADELAQHWRSITRRDGARNYHRLIRYVSERRRLKARWEGALETTAVPLRFVWGLQDPVSGAPMLDELRRRRPDAAIVELPDVGHYPQLEAPATVVRELERFFAD